MGAGSHWHGAFGVQRSFNKSQSVLCHYINSFGQLLWRSGGAASHWSLWYVGIRETSGAAEWKRKKANKKEGRKQKKVTPDTCRRLNIGTFLSVIPLIHGPCAAETPLPVNNSWRGEKKKTQWNRQLHFPAVKMKSRSMKTKPNGDYDSQFPGCLILHRHTINMYSPKFPFNKDSENENIISPTHWRELLFPHSWRLISSDTLWPAWMQFVS